MNRTFMAAADLRPGDRVVVLRDGYDYPPKLAWVHPGASLLYRRVIGIVTSTDQLGDDRWAVRVNYEEDDFGAIVEPDHLTELLDSHYPICDRCGDLWPCAEERLADEVGRLSDWDICWHCGNPLDLGPVLIVGGNRYHSAPHYATPDGRLCRDAALARQTPP